MTTSHEQYPQLAEHYTRLNQVGEGSFGKVYIGERVEKGNNQNMNSSNTFQPQSQKSAKKRFVALKKLKPYHRKKHLAPVTKIEQFPEVNLMQMLSHPNLMQLIQILSEEKPYEKRHYLVMEWGLELMELVKHKEVMPSSEQVRCIVWQLVQAVAYLHGKGIMHRDIKPSNVFIMVDGAIKLGDFSISRSIDAAENTSEDKSEQENTDKTGNVSTRNYRAPQIIFGSKQYDTSIDIWGLGCTIAEFLLGQTLFPGTTDIHQLELIFRVLGCPQDKWPEAQELPYYLQFDNDDPPVGLTSLIPNTDPKLLDLVEKMLSLNPKKRPIAEEIIQHPYFDKSKSTLESATKELSKVSDYLHDKKLRALLQ